MDDKCKANNINLFCYASKLVSFCSQVLLYINIRHRDSRPPARRRNRVRYRISAIHEDKFAS